MGKPKLFGTDGIRGKANSPTMNTEIAVSVGRAAAYYCRKSRELPQIVIGKDTRASGYMIESALSSGITSMGINVVRTGPLPTPGVGFICRSMRSRLGIVVSASHNPAEENGIKLFGEDGFKLGEREEAEIEGLIRKKVPERHLARASEVGKMVQIHDADGRYVQHLKERFPGRLNLKGLKIAIDTANGAAYNVAPAVFSELGAEIAVINNEPDGLNINKNCGALHPEVICNFTKDVGADIGITLDGDADRVLLSDEKGCLVNGDAILFICARHLNKKKNLGRSTVVGTIVTNHGLDAALKNEGIALVRTDVGDHNVISHMRENGINLGGEPCGHLIYLHHSTTGDGILAALRILSIMQQTGSPLSNLVKPYAPYPQKTINVPVAKKTPFDRVKEIIGIKKGIEDKLNGRGRLVLRYSGTEMVARVTVESDDMRLSSAFAEEMADAVRRSLGA